MLCAACTACTQALRLRPVWGTVTALQNGMVMVGVDSNLIQGVRGLLFLLLVAAAQKRPHGLPAPEG